MIQDYLMCIYNDFKNYIDTGNKLCKLKGLHFDLVNWPDYSDENIQQLYLLRYAYAYAFEYKNMFDVVFNKDTELLNNKEIKILSLGCGACLDYMGARYALDTYSNCTSYISYTGIDRIDWQQNSPEPKYNDHIIYNIQSVGDWLNNQKAIDCDVLAFPKSICEFSNIEFGNICNILKTVTFNRDAIHLLVTLRNTDKLLAYDISRTKGIVDALCKNGYSTLDNASNCTNFKNKAKGILSYDNTFSYPEDALEMLKTLNKHCGKYHNGRNCNNDCIERLVRSPILKPTLIAYQIISFER